MNRYQEAIRDLLAVGKRLRVTNLVSADEGFTDVEGFTVYRPDDLKG